MRYVLDANIAIAAMNGVAAVRDRLARTAKIEDVVRMDAAVGRAVAAQAPVAHDRPAAQPLRGQDLAEDRRVGCVDRAQVDGEIRVGLEGGAAVLPETFSAK